LEIEDPTYGFPWIKNKNPSVVPEDINIFSLDREYFKLVTLLQVELVPFFFGFLFKVWASKIHLDAFD
jgi:hypothetical protein